MRRSSFPTLTKTKAASSLPVFDPANMAGTPYAFLTGAFLAICDFLVCAGWLRANNDHGCDQQAEKDWQQHRRHQPLAKVEFSGI
jgi:hypothetical protein